MWLAFRTEMGNRFYDDSGGHLRDSELYQRHSFIRANHMNAV